MKRKEVMAMIRKTPSENSLEDVVLQAFDSIDERVLEMAPNLSPEDCWFLVYSAMGYHLGKCKYFGLAFPLEDSAHINILRDLSNGYLEVRNGVVRMGVLELQNLEKILRAPYIKPGSVHISEDVCGGL